MKYRVRFHLLGGKHYKHWQIRQVTDNDILISSAKDAKYVDPTKFQIEMFGCKLINKIKIAERVNIAGQRDVCGWVLCDNYILHDKDSICTETFDFLIYDPINDIHWRRCSDGNEFDWDGTSYDTLLTNGKVVYIFEESVCLV